MISACDLRVLQHPPDLLLQDRGILELALFGDGEKFLIGNAAPEEERKARCQFDVGDAVCFAGRHVVRIALKPEHELADRRESVAAPSRCRYRNRRCSRPFW